MYVKKIKIFLSHLTTLLEENVNEFLAKEVELGFTILDIKYQMEGVNAHTCLIYYSEPVRGKEE